MSLSPRTLAPRALRLAALPLALAACDADPTGTTPVGLRGVVVLNGFGAQGVSSLDTALASREFVAFDAGFDGGSFVFARDTALATSSKGGGDKLYVADVAARTLRTFQLPAGSNPARAVFLPSAQGTSRFGVALRDSSAIAVVAVPNAAGSTPTVTLLRGAGRCPSDLFFAGAGDVWSLDANARCDSDYAVVGPARFIRIAASGARDTLSLATGARGSAVGTVVYGDNVFVSTSGEVNFATGAVTAAPQVSRVAPLTRQIIATHAMPAGFYGATMTPGLDGVLYVASYDVAAGYKTRVFAMDPASGQFIGARAPGQLYLNLRRADGTLADCSAVAVDAASRVYCAENGTAAAATVTLFSASGTVIRSGAAGQGAVDLALR